MIESLEAGLVASGGANVEVRDCDVTLCRCSKPTAQRPSRKDDGVLKPLVSRRCATAT